MDPEASDVAGRFPTMSVTVRQYRKSERVGFEVDIRFEWPFGGGTFRRRLRAPVNTEAQARKWGEAREREFYAAGPKSPITESKRATPDPDVKEVPKLEAFVSRYLAHARAEKQKASTVDTKDRILRKHIVPLLGTKRLDEITNEDVQRLKERLSVHSAKTANNVCAVLSHLFTVAIDWDIVRKESRPRIKRLKHRQAEPGFLDFDEYERLVEAARKVDPRAHLAVRLGGDAGLRRGEILALRWSDVDLKRRILTVRTSVWQTIEDAPKGGATRYVELTNALHAALSAHRHLRGPYVLCHEDGRRLTPETVQHWQELATTRAGLMSTRGLHILRHTFCSHLAMRGATLKQIQALAGHSTPLQTARYMHLSPAGRASAIRLLDGRIGEGLEKAGT